MEEHINNNYNTAQQYRTIDDKLNKLIKEIIYGKESI